MTSLQTTLCDYVIMDIKIDYQQQYARFPTNKFGTSHVGGNSSGEGMFSEGNKANIITNRISLGSSSIHYEI